MKRKSKFLLIIIIVLTVQAVLFGTVGAVIAEFSVKSNSEIETLIRSDVDKIISEGYAKGAVATLVIDGRVVLNEGFGIANEFLGIKVNTNQTGFRIGSLSKTFVAVATLIARQDGLLDFNKDISFYLEDDFPKLKFPVTMQNLLTHTAGFEEIITGMAVSKLSELEPLNITVRKYMPEQIYEPGEIASYSNYGIALAGYVIEKATGTDFADYCMQKIFVPLGMKSTTFDYTEDSVAVSEAYLPDGSFTQDLYMNLYPEGSMVTTGQDMAEYLKWLTAENDYILEYNNKLELFQRQYSMADELGGIGLIWNRFERNGIEYFSKKGETLHFYTRAVVIPDLKAGLFLSFNTYVPESVINKIASAFIDELLGAKPESLEKDGETINIKGVYANYWSSFETAEKVLRYFVPGKMVNITGSLDSGFEFNGEKISHAGNNSYDTPIGKVKFIIQDGKTLMATDFSQTYIKVSVIESKTFVYSIVVIFSIYSIVYLSIVMILKLRKNIGGIYLPIAAVLQLIALVSLILCVFAGIAQYALLNYTILIQIISWLLKLLVIVNISHELIIRKNNENRIMKYARRLNLVISVGFVLVLTVLNFLF